MKYNLLLIVAIIASLSSTTKAQEPYWEQTHGPSGKTIKAMAVGKDNSIYIAEDRLWKTNDNGRTWKDITGTLPTRMFNSIAILGKDTLYVGEYWNSGGASEPRPHSPALYRTTDDGITWDTVKHDIIAIEMEFTPEGLLCLTGFVNYADDNQFISNDSGKSWRSIEGAVPREYYDKAHISPLNDGSILKNSQKILYRSIDTGRTWNKLPSLEIAESKVSQLSTGELIVYGTYNTYSGLWISRDTGLTWDTLARGMKSTYSITNNDHIYAIKGNDIEYSTDIGKTWKTLAASAPYRYPSTLLLTDNLGNAVVAGNDSMYIVSGANNSFTNFQSAPENNIQAIGENLSGVIFACIDNLPSQSYDNGNTWSFAPYSDKPSFGNDIWRLGSDSSGGLLAAKNRSLYRSTNAGESWSKIKDGVATSSGDIRFSTSLAGTIFVLSPENGLSSSTNEGISWSSINSFGINKTLDVECTSDGAVLVAADNQIFRSTDDGNNWTMVADLHDTAFLFSGTVYLRAISLRSTISGTVVAGTSGEGAIRSTDNGKSWSAMRKNAEEAEISQLAPLPDGGMFAIARYPIASSKKIIYLPEGGQRWYDAHLGLGDVNDINTIATTRSGKAFVGTATRGIFQQIRTVNAVRKQKDQANRLSLKIYPNPSATNCIINFSLENNMAIQAALVDQLGRTILSHDPIHCSTGNNTISFDISTVPNGTYFVSIVADGYSTVEKLLVLH